MAKEDDKSVRTNNFTYYILQDKKAYPYNKHEALKKPVYSWRLKMALGIVPHHMITKDDK